ncbi:MULTISPECIES: PhnD/SsuA/transferrin family substrate-binding protein [unclassified Acinetobacter]|uniref:PhnD/SsuA/transferrin family substrate-binding protein n=1 Tax=unclassified Acinetobacter TaxID=196816 RepID=UPI0035B8C984
MAYNFLIAPDFAPERFAGWHLLNTLLQKRMNAQIHLLTPASHTEQCETVLQGNVSVIYANPFDATALIREHGYRAIARPIAKPDEMVIASASEGTIKQLTDLKPEHSVAMADNRDVKLIGLRLLEAVDLTENDLQWKTTETYQAAARQVIKGEADVAFFLAEAFHSLARLTKSQLNVLIESQLNDISHVVLVKQDWDKADQFAEILLNLHQDSEGADALTELGFAQGFEVMHEEDAEFMIDLMDTLID